MRRHIRSLTFMLTLVAVASMTLPQTAGAVWPNPFTDSDKVHFQLSMPKAGAIKIQVFDIIGRPIKLLFEGPHEEGKDDVTWDGDDESGDPVIAGIYICVLFSDGVPVNSVKVVKLGFK